MGWRAEPDGLVGNIRQKEHRVTLQQPQLLIRPASRRLRSAACYCSLLRRLQLLHLLPPWTAPRFPVQCPAASILVARRLPRCCRLQGRLAAPHNFACCQWPTPMAWVPAACICDTLHSGCAHHLQPGAPNKLGIHHHCWVNSLSYQHTHIMQAASHHHRQLCPASHLLPVHGWRFAGWTARRPRR